MFARLPTIKRFIVKTAYRKEILFVLTLKLIGLTLLWAFCFSTPIDQRLTSHDVVARILLR